MAKAEQELLQKILEELREIKKVIENQGYEETDEDGYEPDEDDEYEPDEDDEKDQHDTEDLEPDKD